MVAAMRIDASSLIAAQSAQRPTQTAPKPPQPADNPLFEPLIFPQAQIEAAPAKPLSAGPQQTPPRRPGALLDITV
jgi:hypothetical protein